jgi:hypothetical protein
MTHSLHRLRNLSALGTLLSLFMLLAACSPGTGGTGTGPVSAQPTAPTGTAGPAPVPTTVPNGSPPPSLPVSTQFNTATFYSNFDPATGSVSQATGVAVNAQLQSQGIVISTACATFTYAGPWTAAADGKITVQGDYTSAATTAGQTAGPTTPSSQSATATITITSLGGNDVAWVSVLGNMGVVLISPTLLARSPSAPVLPASNACGS